MPVQEVIKDRKWLNGLSKLYPSSFPRSGSGVSYAWSGTAPDSGGHRALVEPWYYWLSATGPSGSTSILLLTTEYAVLCQKLWLGATSWSEHGRDLLLCDPSARQSQTPIHTHHYWADVGESSAVMHAAINLLHEKSHFGDVRSVHPSEFLWRTRVHLE